jgi:hypothetical protein
MRGGLKKLTLNGYTPIIPFKPDETTLFWNLWTKENKFRVRFTNNETAHKFRLKLEGITNDGKTFHYETIIQ